MCRVQALSYFGVCLGVTVGGLGLQVSFGMPQPLTVDPKPHILRINPKR